MNQMFFGNARIMFFDIGSQPPAPSTKKTKFTFIDGTSEQCNVNGEINETWLTQNGFYSSGTWTKGKIISIELGKNASVDQSALTLLDLAPVYDGNGQRFSEWTPSTNIDGYHIRWHEANPASPYDKSGWGLLTDGTTDVWMSDLKGTIDSVLIEFLAEESTFGFDFTVTRTENNIIGYTHRATLYKYANDTEWRTVSIIGQLSGDYGAPTTLIPDAYDIVSLEIGTDVTSIGATAFISCSRLTSVTIPNSVTIIDDFAFRNCRGLASVTIPNSVTKIGEEAFSGCSNLTNITIPDSVTTIYSLAFDGCIGLTSVTIVANGGNANNVKIAMIDAGVPSNITWNGVD